MLIQTSHSTLELGLTVERLLSELEENFPQFLPQPNDPTNMMMYLGDLVEFNETKKIFLKPDRKETEDYITGRFG